MLDTNGLVLFRLDAAEYPLATRKVASWILLGNGAAGAPVAGADIGGAPGSGKTSLLRLLIQGL